MPIFDVAPPPEQPADPRLGRLVHFDRRSADYPIRELLPAKRPRSYTWSCLPYLDQGNVGACVGFSISHELAARPVVRPASNELGMDIYKAAQKRDPWPGEAYEGTSVLAGMQEAQARGLIQEYRWAGVSEAPILEDLILAVGYRGPAVLGIPWHTEMFSPDARGFIRREGAVAGGHAIMMNGVTVRWPSTVKVAARSFANLDLDASYARLHNSWGTWWGKGGDCFVTLRDLDALLHGWGEACVPVVR